MMIGHLPHTYEIRRRFDPTYSVLGRYLRRRFDPLQAEAKLYIRSTLLLIAILLASFFVWAILNDSIVADRGASVLFWVAQVLVVVGFVSTTLIGFSPPATVTLTSDHLRITQAGHDERLLLNAVRKFEQITATEYYRHYRKYRRVRSFVGPLRNNYLLIRSEDQTIVLGLTEDEQAEVMRYMRRPVVADISRAARRIAG